MNNKVAIMQPYFFPYLGYFQLINSVDRFVLYDDVTYIKGGWINRNKILLNGFEYLVTLPLIKASSFSLIKDINVTENIKVKEKILKTITAAYSKAPFYENLYPFIESLFNKNGSISDIIYDSIIWIKNYLNIQTEIIISSTLNKNFDENLSAQDKVIKIVKMIEGETYINSIGGQELYEKDVFKMNGIELFFIKMNEIKYKQFNNNFVPNLSIIDVMMFNSPERIMEMLNDYKFI